MTPTEDQMDALNDTIRRLRSELERVREAGRAVVGWWDSRPTYAVDTFGLFAALRTALEGEGGK